MKTKLSHWWKPYQQVFADHPRLKAILLLQLLAFAVEVLIALLLFR